MKQRFRTFLAFLLAALVAMPAAAQSTRILDGSYVTKYGRFRNFVINPDAQVNNASVTATNATASRGTTTPVSENGTTEFNVTITSANGTVDFLASGATQAILGGQLCEVGFRGRGFQSTSAIQAFDGTNVLASYTFGILSSTQDVSVPFPCPTDPSNIRVRITDTSTLSGTNEIAGVYFGKARNVQNVSQAEHVGTLNYAAATNCQWTNAFTATAPGSFAADTDCATPTVTGSLTAPATKIPGFTFTARPGRYQIFVAGQVIATRAAAGENICARVTDGTNTSNIQCLYSEIAGATNIAIGSGLILGELEYSSTQTVTVQLQAGNNGSSAQVDARSLPLRFTVYRVPNATQLAVTPENQNVWGAVQFSASSATVANTASTWTTFNNAAFGSGNGTYLGGATALSTGTCGTTNDLGVCLSNLPAGQYRVTFNGVMYADFSAAKTICAYSITDGTSRTGSGQATAGVSGAEDSISSMSGVFNYTSAQSTAAFRLQSSRLAGSGACNVVISNSSNSERTPAFIVERINTRITQPIFIQSPVRAAGTSTAPLSTEIGYPLDTESGATVTTLSNAYTAVASATLPSVGNYLISANCRLNVNGTMSTAEYVLDLKGSSSGNAPKYGDSWLFSTTNTPSRVTLKVTPFLVRYDGTNINFPDGTTLSGATITANIYPGVYTGSNNTAACALRTFKWFDR